jgi:hypothetical protein
VTAESECRPVYVLGVAHSGTSILHKTLAQHPDATWFPNTRNAMGLCTVGGECRLRMLPTARCAALSGTTGTRRKEAGSVG